MNLQFQLTGKPLLAFVKPLIDQDHQLRPMEEMESGGHACHMDQLVHKDQPAFEVVDQWLPELLLTYWDHSQMVVSLLPSCQDA